MTRINSTDPLRFHLTLRSSNRKTGPIAVSTSSRELCPKSCSFYDNGCYASTGPLALHWAAVTSGTRGITWREFLKAVEQLPQGGMFRHNQAGDIRDPNTAAGRRDLIALANAARGKVAWTYTHHRRGMAAVQAIRSATALGFTVNASCESEAQADAAMASGLRAVFVVRSDDTRRHWRTADGNHVVTCPAQVRDEMTCERCKLCARRPNNVAIAFRAHGTGKRSIDAVLELAP